MNDFDLTQNFFQVFNLSVDFSIDKNKLVKAFQDLQSQYHPDKFASQSDADSRLSMQISSAINEAYQTLKDPIKRAIYIMQINGVDLNTETDTNMDMDFLMRQMELRESMDSVSKNEQGLEKIDTIATDVNQQLKGMMTDVEILLQKQAWDEAREILRQVQFMNKIHMETKKIQESIEDSLY